VIEQQQQQLFLEYEYVLRRSERIAAAINTDKELILLYSEADEARAALRGRLSHLRTSSDARAACRSKTSHHV